MFYRTNILQRYVPFFTSRFIFEICCVFEALFKQQDLVQVEIITGIITRPICKYNEIIDAFDMDCSGDDNVRLLGVSRLYTRAVSLEDMSVESSQLHYWPQIPLNGPTLGRHPIPINHKQNTIYLPVPPGLVLVLRRCGCFPDQISLPVFRHVIKTCQNARTPSQTMQNAKEWFTMYVRVIIGFIRCNYIGGEFVYLPQKMFSLTIETSKNLHFFHYNIIITFDIDSTII